MAKETREYVWLECSVCGAKNYRTERSMKQGQGPPRLELKKFCKKEKKHTLHKESRKK